MISSVRSANTALLILNRSADSVGLSLNTIKNQSGEDCLPSPLFLCKIFIRV